MNLVFALSITVAYLLYVFGGFEADHIIASALVFLVLMEAKK